ncbi:hypothetical protein GCM10007377_08300 [Galliscardovia ingluviei]|uniref:HNH/Endo VII superfamily nuclease toxins domain-containing protein n=2 Tax=Galliscardovia ingluviei TaxID=1769422 RepID=A0A8J3EZ06_9BIFI|nr:hypothetical protein GCM10007377_08300 [Galliscardovia ingluviei]
MGIEYDPRDNEYTVVIQDHTAGHQFGAEGGKGDQPAHVHARPAANPWTGSIDGAQRHYYFENDE